MLLLRSRVFSPHLRNASATIIKLPIRSFASHASENVSPQQLKSLYAIQGIREEDIIKQDFKKLPDIQDILVKVTLIDFQGKQHPIVGLVGQTLM